MVLESDIFNQNHGLTTGKLWPKDIKTYNPCYFDNGVIMLEGFCIEIQWHLFRHWKRWGPENHRSLRFKQIIKLQQLFGPEDTDCLPTSLILAGDRNHPFLSLDFATMKKFNDINKMCLSK